MKLQVTVDTASREELVEGIETLTHSLNRLDGVAETTLEEDLDAAQKQAAEEAAQAQAKAEAEAKAKAAAQQQQAPQTPAAGGDTPPANDVDKDGVPWDARIHSAGKTKVKAGTWKLKKGVDKALVEQVTAELLAQTAGANTPPATETAAPPAANTPAPAPAPSQAPVTPPPTTPAEPEKYLIDGVGYTMDQLLEAGWTEDQVADLEVEQPAAPETPAPVAGAETEWTFPDLISAIAANNIPADQVEAAVKEVGLASQVLLGTRPDLVPTVAQKLGLA